MPKGTFGLGTTTSGRVVTFVQPHSAAADAGIRVGDRIDTRYQNLHERLFVGTGFIQIGGLNNIPVATVPFPGERVTLHVMHAGREHVVTLTARAHHPSGSDTSWEIHRFVVKAIDVLLGAALVLVRPGLVTWAFYAYMLGLGGAGVSDYFNVVPAPLWLALIIPEQIIGGAVFSAYALFWLLFPAGDLTGWRRPVALMLVMVACVSITVELSQLLGVAFNFDASSLDWTFAAFDVIVPFIGVVAMCERYARSQGFERRLFGLLFFAVAFGYTTETTAVSLNLLNVPPLPIFSYLFPLIGLLLPIIMGYAIVRYQMFDVEYVFSRAIVYGMIAIAVASVFAGIDLAFASYFQGSKAELAVDIALALAVGFALKALHNRAIDVVDRLLFVRRYDSRMWLKAAFDAVARAESRAAIEDILTRKAADALGLASAVFFRRYADGGFLREKGFGLAPDSLWNLLPDDTLAKLLERRPNAVDLRSIEWTKTNECAPQAPAMAVAMQFSNSVVGVTLYGDRLDGVLLSPDDISGLVSLSRRAATPYAFFEAKGSDSLTRELASARVAP